MYITPITVIRNKKNNLKEVYKNWFCWNRTNDTIYQNICSTNWAKNRSISFWHYLVFSSGGRIRTCVLNLMRVARWPLLYSALYYEFFNVLLNNLQYKYTANLIIYQIFLEFFFHIFYFLIYLGELVTF